MHTSRLMAAALCFFAWAGGAAAAENAPEASAILKSTEIRGGLCLMIGAETLSPAASLARESGLYIQLLQPDRQMARAWGQRLADGPLRERLAVRSAAFDAAHYGSDLFNLIVVEDPAALGDARMSDLLRILVPRGVVVFRKAPAGFADAAAGFKMAPLSVEKFAAAFGKPVTPITWKLPLTLKWQAGPRSQIANGYTGICTGDGKLFYMERMEVDRGDLNISTARLIARDAYNGRTLWAKDAGRWGGTTVAANRKGRLFVKTHQDKRQCKVVHLDGATGEVLLEMPSAGHRDSRVKCLTGDLLYVGGRIYAAETGKFLWTFPRYRYQPMRGTIIGENIYFCEGKELQARKLADGTVLWKKPLEGVPGPYAWMSRAGKDLLVRLKGKRDECPISILNSADGKVLWSYTWKVRISSSERYFTADKVRFKTMDGKLLMYYRHNQEGVYADEVVITRMDLATGKEEIKNRVLKDAGDFHGCFPELQLGDHVAYYDLWVNMRTLKTSLRPENSPHPACFFGSKPAYGMIYNFPSRKSGPITAVGPADVPVDDGPGGRILKKFGSTESAEATGPGDWPMFRGNPAGGNSVKAMIGAKPVKAWEASIGLGPKHFGTMTSQRTGLTQAVLAYGLAVVADIDGQRIVALNAEDGKQKWVFHVGSRVDYPPTLYKGLCLFAARDGWVYCLDAKEGSLLWKLLVPARERYVGGWEKLESVHPLTSDVLIVNGVAYVSTGKGGLAFKPETGELVEARSPGKTALGRQSIPGGRELMMSYDLVIKGNSIPRTNEDNKHGFRMQRFKRRLDARVLAFDGALTAAYIFKPRGEGWANRGWLHLMAVGKDANRPLWKSPPIELVVDDIVLTPKHVYCVGHYQRIKKAPELWIVSREDGRVIQTVPVGGFPAFLGMSASGKRLFVSTREGKLICFEGK